MDADFDTRTKYKVGDEVHCRIGSENTDVVGKVVGIHLTADHKVSYAVSIQDYEPSNVHHGLTKVPEAKIRGLTDNMPWLTRMRRRLHIR